MGNYVTVTNGSGSPGVYGDGMTATVVVNSSGNITDFTILSQGTSYKIGDSFGLPGTSAAGSGTSFQFTILPSTSTNTAPFS